MKPFLSRDKDPDGPGYAVRDRFRGHRIGWVAATGGAGRPNARFWRALCSYVGCKERAVARGATRPAAATGLFGHWQERHQ